MRLPDNVQARLLGLAVALAGAVTVISTLFAPWRARARLVEDLFTPGTIQLASGAAALLGLMLILLGRGVATRRRLAWLATVVLLVVTALSHLVKGLDVEEAAVDLALVGVLAWRRGLFVVSPGPPRLISLARLAAALVALDFAYGVIGLAIHHADVHPHLTPLRGLVEIGSELAGLPGPLIVGGWFGRWFPASLTMLGAVTLTILMLAALAPVALRGGGPERDRTELLLLLDRGNGDTLDPFVLRRDKRWVFSPDRRAALGYRYVHGVGLASGDPVGRSGSFPGVVATFLALCNREGWRPAIVGAREGRHTMYEAHGLHAIYIGDEAIIDVAGFSLQGRLMRNVRQAVNRTHNAGVTTQILQEGDVDQGLRHALLEVAATHRGQFREFGFSMALGDLVSGAYPDCLLVVCHDREGHPIAFQRYVPCCRRSALSLDSMRRLPDAPNGVNERMLIDVINWGRTRGMVKVSLNFAAFRALLEPGQPRGLAEATEAWFVRRLEGRFGIQMDSLRRFNAKFQPRWVPRYLMYRSAADLPAIGLAALSAEGFIPFDRGRAVDPATHAPRSSASRAGRKAGA